MLAVDDADRGGRALLRPPDELEVGGNVPLEVGGGALAGYDEAYLELFILRHEVGRLELDGALRQRLQAASEHQQSYC